MLHSFYCPMEDVRCTALRVLSLCPSLYIPLAVVIKCNCMLWNLNLGPLLPQWKVIYDLFAISVVVICGCIWCSLWAHYVYIVCYCECVISRLFACSFGCYIVQPSFSLFLWAYCVVFSVMFCLWHHLMYYYNLLLFMLIVAQLQLSRSWHKCYLRTSIFALSTHLPKNIIKV